MDNQCWKDGYRVLRRIPTSREAGWGPPWTLPGPHCRHRQRKEVMTRLHIILLAGGVALSACGCTGPSRPQDPVNSGVTTEQQAADNLAQVKSRGKARSPCLEDYGFAVLEFRAIRDAYGMVSVIGEIRNVGPAARGVELQATLRDRNGRLTAVGHFYPASCTNIIPDETWPFTYSFGSRQDAVSAELRIVGAFRTIDMD